MLSFWACTLTVTTKIIKNLSSNVFEYEKLTEIQYF